MSFLSFSCGPSEFPRYRTPKMAIGGCDGCDGDGAEGDGDDAVLSDLHLELPPGAEYATTLFDYSGTGDAAESAGGEAEEDATVAAGPAPAATAYDADGDPVVKRRRRTGGGGALRLRHECETPLAGVGMQVWRGTANNNSRPRRPKLASSPETNRDGRVVVVLVARVWRGPIPRRRKAES